MSIISKEMATRVKLMGTLRDLLLGMGQDPRCPVKDETLAARLQDAGMNLPVFPIREGVSTDELRAAVDVLTSYITELAG